MGLTKQYLRYSPSGKFNIIANGNCNIACVTLEGQAGRYVAVGACEDIIIWDLRLGEKAQVIPGEKHIVTHLCAAPDNRHLAAGYADGTVLTYDLKTGENVSTFSGHRTAITCLSYDLQGHRLASASKDTDIVIWDIVGETGINRLCGHKGVVTQVEFFEEHNILISSSKDTYVKFWDLDTAHCFKTLVSHKSEVWALCLLRNDQYLVTGCGDNELRVWKIAFKDGETATDNTWKVMNLEGLESILPADDQENDSLSPLTCTKVGSVLRKGKGRVVSLKADATGQILLCHGNGNIVEVFYFKNETESLEHFKKRQRKLKKRLSKISDIAEQTIEPVNIEQGLADEVTRLPIVTASSKVKSANLVIGGGKEIRVAICLNNNLIELHSIQGFTKDSECTCLRKIAAQGHHSEVRSLCFSSDNLAIASGSGESVKMWNRPSLTCLRTLETNYTLSICFAPGDRHVLVGMKDGQLLIADIAAGEILETVPAHTKELWTVSLTPDKRGCVTGSGDATVKFWQFELVNVPESKAKVLSVLHKRTLKLEEGVLAVKMSPNSALIAVSLLDSTVKIFFVDTLKFFVSLYGHHLPVLCMDICHDSTLIATGSADRNVKIWGLDFGDCHRSLFAHDDSITAIQFVPKTHHFFTCGKDGRVKYWDADTYNKILTLQAHHGEAWSLAVSPNGQYVASSGSDGVVRVFERTSEPVVLEDEAEEEREAEENAALATGEETIVPGQFNLNLPSKKTVGSEKAAERLLEAIDVYKEYKAELLAHKKVDDKASAPQVPILMAAYKTSNPEDFLIEILCGIRASDLEEALLLLPFTTVCEFLSTLPALLARDHEIEVICRTMMFLLRMHHGPIVSNQGLLPVIKKLKKLAFSKVNKLRDMVGYNSYSLQFVQRELEERNSIQLFIDATVERKTRDKKRRKRERIAKTAVITL